MTAFIDFAELKQRVPIERVVQLLNLTMRPHGEALRGPCPTCKTGGERALVATTGKNLFYCFGAKVGGDAIALAAHIRGVKAAEAARFIADATGVAPVKETGIQATAPQEQKAGANPSMLKPLDYLLAEHEAVQALGISPDTCQHFGAGYAPRGVMRGHIALPIHDVAGGTLLAYCGLLAGPRRRELLFPRNFEPTKHMFNLHRVERGDIVYVADHPSVVLTSYDSGITNCISFLSEVTADTLEVLTLWMHENDIPSVEFLAPT